MKKTILFLIVVAVLAGLYLLISYQGLSSKVKAKRKMLDRALIAQGYRPNYYFLSGYRPPWLNRLLPLAAKNSAHMKGQAIDLFVMDIDGDGEFNDRDLRIVTATLDQLDRKNPAYRGGVGLYRHSSRHMVHFDVSGKHRHWDN